MSRRRRNFGCSLLHTKYLPEASADRQLIDGFGKNSCGSPVVVCGRPWRASRKFGRLVTRALRWRFDHATLHGYLATARMNEVGSRLGFHERRVRQQFTVQPDARVGPSAWSRAMQNVQSIGAVDFRLRLFERNGAA